MRLPPAFQRFDTVNLRLRVISAAMMLPVVLLAIYLGGIAYGALTTCVMTVGLYEWLRLVAPDARPSLVGIALAMLIVVMILGALVSASLGAMLGVVLTIALYLVSEREHKEQAGWIALGLPYMAGSGLALMAIRATPVSGMGLAFYLLITVCSTDIGAFAVGRSIGGAKLAPAISPSKTWAGLFGGMALALVLGYLAALAFGAQHPAVALILSPVLACVAQAGDLFESYFKRRSNVKESGDLIPGHGGILDRIDGLVFAALFAALFQSTIGQHINWW
ncbi:MAG: phosphatidate cytidylyltransferase [Alphaproteobacteria bacterium]